MNNFLKIISIIICTIIIMITPIFLVLSFIFKWSIIVKILLALISIVEAGGIFIVLLSSIKD